MKKKGLHCCGFRYQHTYNGKLIEGRGNFMCISTMYDLYFLWDWIGRFSRGSNRTCTTCRFVKILEPNTRVVCTSIWTPRTCSIPEKISYIFILLLLFTFTSLASTIDVLVKEFHLVYFEYFFSNTYDIWDLRYGYDWCTRTMYWLVMYIRPLIIFICGYLGMHLCCIFMIQQL